MPATNAEFNLHVDKSGKLLILVILAMALASGGFSWWFRWAATHRAADYWGPEAAKMIRDAKIVTAVQLNDYIPPDAGIQDHVAARFDASKARGLIHFKQALIEDRSYDWEHRIPASEAFTARYGVQFDNRPRLSSRDELVLADNARVSLFFNEACTRCCFVLREKRSAIMDCSPISQGLMEIFAAWFPRASN